MNWDPSGAKSYVDVIPQAPIFNPYPVYERPPYWSTPQADARLKPGILRQPCSSEQLRAGAQHFAAPPVYAAGQIQSNSVLPSHRVPLLRTASLPPVELSKQLASTPEIPQGSHSPASSQHTPALPQAGFTPPVSASVPNQQSAALIRNTNMAGPRRISSHQQQQQRPMMGPPETPSRVMQASPNMFPTLQFSPDLFSTQQMGPVTAPIYPQQRLFWDQPTTHPETHPNDVYHNPYQESFDASFHSSSTIVPTYSPVVSQDGTFELPPPQQQSLPPGPFLDTTAFPMPFQTSPRPAPPTIENPTQFLSSPARRFGGSEVPVTSSFQRPIRDLPAYHHQIEESRRERELERRRNKNAAKRADADLIMSSVRRALSPSKSGRPGLKRSFTHSGVATLQRRSSRVSLHDTASVSSTASVESSRNGRASPFRALRQKSMSVLSKSKPHKSRTAMSLAIDENGVAKTILQQLPEPDDGMDLDEDSQSVISSADEGDFNMLQSQTGSFAVDEDGASFGLPTTSTSAASKQAEANRHAVASRAPPDPRGINSMAKVKNLATGKGDAQKALRAIIEDRSRSVSAQGGYSSSRQSDSSVQFHSSPPIQQNQFGDFSGSPTTITDPDLATPSTDQESYGGLGATRCICNSMSPDGSAMIQCDSCSKWLHTNCVGVDKRHMSDVYICLYCEQTPVRHPANRGSTQSSTRHSGNSASPLAHKSTKPNRRR